MRWLLTGTWLLAAVPVHLQAVRQVPPRSLLWVSPVYRPVRFIICQRLGKAVLCNNRPHTACTLAQACWLLHAITCTAVAQHADVLVGNLLLAELGCCSSADVMAPLRFCLQLHCWIPHAWAEALLLTRQSQRIWKASHRESWQVWRCKTRPRIGIPVDRLVSDVMAKCHPI